MRCWRNANRLTISPSVPRRPFVRTFHWVGWCDLRTSRRCFLREGRPFGWMSTMTVWRRGTDWEPLPPPLLTALLAWGASPWLEPSSRMCMSLKNINRFVFKRCTSYCLLIGGKFYFLEIRKYSLPTAFTQLVARRCNLYLLQTTHNTEFFFSFIDSFSRNCLAILFEFSVCENHNLKIYSTNNLEPRVL